MFLLDTNVCIDFALARSERLRARIRQQSGRGMAISSITLAELRLGARRPGSDPKDERALDILVSVLSVMPFDEAAAEAYAALHDHVNFQRNSFDRLIAAHALSLDMTLVTNNECDFADVPELHVENWTKG